MKFIALTTSLILFLFLKGQCQYVIDFGNSQTFQISCGTIASSQWTVKNERCTLFIPDLVMQDISGNYVVPFTFTINQSGNLEFEDSLTLRHQINSGVWITDTVIYGNGGSSVREITDSFFLAYHDTVRFTLDLVTNDPSEFWSIKSGDIAINNAEPVLFLPVELISFTGVYDEQAQSVMLQWSTATETNCSHFVVQRSVDAVNFEPIAVLSGQGNSNSQTNYYYNDVSDQQANVFYYRLIQYDFDGSENILSLVVVNIAKSEYTLLVTDNSGIIILTLSRRMQSGGVLDVYSTQGDLIYKKNVEASATYVQIDLPVFRQYSILVFCYLSDYELVLRKVFVR